jgi:cyclin-dependent kinase 7
MLLEGVKYLHDNWILHRDLKPGNLMLSQNGVLKLIDFGLSTDYPPDLGEFSPEVVTSWYRPPELFFRAPTHGPAVDMWSVGCIFAEMLRGTALLPGTTDEHMLQLIADLFGPIVWPGVDKLPGFVKVLPKQPPPALSSLFSALSIDGRDLLSKFFVLDPLKRITAADALQHPYFQLEPRATLSSELPHLKELAGQGGVATGMITDGGVTARTKYAPGTTLQKAAGPPTRKPPPPTGGN